MFMKRILAITLVFGAYFGDLGMALIRGEAAPTQLGMPFIGLTAAISNLGIIYLLGTILFFIGDNGAPLKIHKLDAPGGGPGWDGEGRGVTVRNRDRRSPNRAWW